MIAASLARALDPAAMARAAGYELDRWQAAVLRRRHPQTILNCSRQAGKSLATALGAVHEALFYSPALVLLYAPTQRQSELLYAKVRAVLRALDDVPTYQEDTRTSLQLSNGSRVACLPGDEATTRGFSGVNLLVIDEASRCSDLLYAGVRPMLAVSAGRIVLLSTPWGRRGFYWEVWSNGGPAWYRVQVTAAECPRITAEWLRIERDSLPERLYRQEYECSFEDIESQVFATELVTEAFTPNVKPLFPGGVR